MFNYTKPSEPHSVDTQGNYRNEPDLTVPVVPPSVYDENLFVELMGQYWPDIRRYLLRLTGEVALAEDLTQETFFKAYRSLSTRQSNTALSFRPWLYKIATNLAISHSRYKKRHSCLSIEEMGEQVPGGEIDWPDSSYDPADRSLEAEESREVVATLAALPTEQVAILLLRFYHDLGYNEIGQTLGIKEEAVRARVHRARQAFVRVYHRLKEKS